MQHINDPFKLYSVNGPPGVVVKIVHNLQYGSAFKSFQGFGIASFLTLLGLMKRIAHNILYFVRKRFPVVI
ncbi:MAG TPA: hypothetical protein VI727_08560 [Candidatus Brocadiaceae bacterium]|nr:hypothetical protein [Candidatus Brocadiaceae bacterium]